MLRSARSDAKLRLSSVQALQPPPFPTRISRGLPPEVPEYLTPSPPAGRGGLVVRYPGTSAPSLSAQNPPNLVHENLKKCTIFDPPVRLSARQISGQRPDFDVRSPYGGSKMPVFMTQRRDFARKVDFRRNRHFRPIRA